MIFNIRFAGNPHIPITHELHEAAKSWILSDNTARVELTKSDPACWRLLVLWLSSLGHRCVIQYNDTELSWSPTNPYQGVPYLKEIADLVLEDVPYSDLANLEYGKIRSALNDI